MSSKIATGYQRVHIYRSLLNECDVDNVKGDLSSGG